jgi:hypothetical protein
MSVDGCIPVLCYHSIDASGSLIFNVTRLVCEPHGLSFGKSLSGVLHG